MTRTTHRKFTFLQSVSFNFCGNNTNSFSETIPLSAVTSQNYSIPPELFQEEFEAYTLLV